MLVSSTCPGDLLELEGRSPSGDRLNRLFGRPTGAGRTEESEWRLSQQPGRETYWSWREGVRVETGPTACPGDLLELEGRSPSGDCLNKLNRSMELEGGTPEFKLMQMDERHQRWINAVMNAEQVMTSSVPQTVQPDQQHCVNLMLL